MSCIINVDQNGVKEYETTYLANINLVLENDERFKVYMSCEPGHEKSLAIMILGYQGSSTYELILESVGENFSDKIAKKILKHIHIILMGIAEQKQYSKPLISPFEAGHGFGGDDGE